MKTYSGQLCCLLLGVAGAIYILRSKIHHLDPVAPFPLSAGIHAKIKAVNFKGVPAEFALSGPDADKFGNEDVHEILRRWLATDVADTEIRNILSRRLVALLTARNAAQIVRDLSIDEFHTPFGAKAFECWLIEDPGPAADWIAARRDSTEEHALTITRYMATNLDKLCSYCERLPEGEWRKKMLSQAVFELAESDPAIAVRIAQMMNAGEEQTNALEMSAFVWFGRDFSAAANWTNSIDNPLLREKLLALSAKAISVTDPDLGADWLTKAVKSESLLTETALDIIDLWADRSPSQAANWLAHMTDASFQDQAIDRLLGRWMKSDAVAARAWLQTLPAREARRAN
ncbi:MAG: hypothetical protein QM760_16015 [Nibricoccus sp.]